MSKYSFLLLFCCIWFISCNKDRSANLASSVSVKFIEDPYPVSIQDVQSAWDPASGTGYLTADGFSHNRFMLSLQNVHDTGNIKLPGIKNIFYTDGLNFSPDSLYDGYIHVASVADDHVNGNFRVALQDHYNGSEMRVLEGSFMIYR